MGAKSDFGGGSTNTSILVYSYCHTAPLILAYRSTHTSILVYSYWHTALFILAYSSIRTTLQLYSYCHPGARELCLAAAAGHSLRLDNDCDFLGFSRDDSLGLWPSRRS